MNNAQKNIKFLNTTDSETKSKVLENIANHYQIREWACIYLCVDATTHVRLNTIAGKRKWKLQS